MFAMDDQQVHKIMEWRIPRVVEVGIVFQEKAKFTDSLCLV